MAGVLPIDILAWYRDYNSRLTVAHHWLMMQTLSNSSENYTPETLEESAGAERCTDTALIPAASYRFPVMRDVDTTLSLVAMSYHESQRDADTCLPLGAAS